VTPAVIVTGWPKAVVFGDNVSAVEVENLFTVCVRAVDELAAKFVLPL